MVNTSGIMDAVDTVQVEVVGVLEAGADPVSSTSGAENDQSASASPAVPSACDLGVEGFGAILIKQIPLLKALTQREFNWVTDMIQFVLTCTCRPTCKHGREKAGRASCPLRLEVRGDLARRGDLAL